MLHKTPFLYNLSDKFFDVDDIDLDYEIINAPNWIVLDELTNSLIGTPKNINVGNNNLILKVSDGRRRN